MKIRHTAYHRHTRMALAGLTGFLLAVFSITGESMMSTNDQNTAQGKSQVIDNLADTSVWHFVIGRGATMNISADQGEKGAQLCMDYSLGEQQTHALIAKPFNTVLPEHYEIHLLLKYTSPENNLEVKFIDHKGNTFMKKWYAFGSVDQWQEIVIPQKEMHWAWGPDSGAKLDRVKEIELGVTGSGKTGRLCLAQLKIVPVSAEKAALETKKESNGFCPRWVSHEQAYWTITGVMDDDNEVLICEDGTIEPIKRSPSIQPLLAVNGKIYTRNEATITQSLAQDCLPIPSVQWQIPSLIMNVQVFAYGEPGQSMAYAKYTVRNTGTAAIQGALLLSVLPYQVYPPWQGGGGFSPVYSMSKTHNEITVNDKPILFMANEPDRFYIANENGDPGQSAREILQSSCETTTLTNKNGFAAGTLAYNFDLSPEQEKEVYILYPLQHPAPETATETAQKMASVYDPRLKETISFWDEKVNRVGLNIADTNIINTFKANVAYNLITKDGPALQPGSRSYDKAWMRDGAIAAMALLEAGLTNTPREFIEWFATFQQPGGEIPPIIDTKAENPLWEEHEKGLIEYDSQGEFIWIAMQYYRFTKDRAFLERMWPHVLKSLEFIQSLRQKRLTEKYEDASSPDHIYYGILPESTSHEGYHLKHSYWDDFWALKGWEDARDMAIILDETNRLDWIDSEYADFKKCVYQSIHNVTKSKGIDYLPGCAELGDIDPTSSAASIIYCDQIENLPPDQMQHTFDRFEADLKNRLRPGSNYRFTPYEMRTTAAYIRMGRRDTALALLRFMLQHSRPTAWHHLAEVADSDYRCPCYIGDMPHTWVGAEYINAVRTLFVYEEDGKLVLGAGIDPTWLKDGKHVTVTNLPTAFGTLNYDIHLENDAPVIQITGDANPPNGFELKLTGE